MFDRWKKPKAPSGAPEYLVVGLGNPGAKYETTRHNAGFLCVEALCDKYGFTVKKLKFNALIGDAVIGAHRVIVMKPQTMMNNSGEAVRECASFYKIPPERVIVISDDVSLPVGALRIKRRGSAGGHNGLKSIIACLGSEDFPRIKLGVGDKKDGADIIDHVLGSFPKADIPVMREAMLSAADALPYILDGNIDEAMNLYNKS